MYGSSEFSNPSLAIESEQNDQFPQQLSPNWRRRFASPNKRSAKQRLRSNKGDAEGDAALFRATGDANRLKQREVSHQRQPQVSHERNPQPSHDIQPKAPHERKPEASRDTQRTIKQSDPDSQSGLRRSSANKLADEADQLYKKMAVAFANASAAGDNYIGKASISFRNYGQRMRAWQFGKSFR